MTDQTEVIHLTNQQARKFLAKYHFLSPARSLSYDQIAPVLMSRFGCIQFDSINVVGRNADLVLQSRIKNYRPEVLDRMLYKDRVLIDGWDKVASIYQTEDWPYFERHRKRMYEYHSKRSPEVIGIIPKILTALKKNGALASIDFKDNSKTDWAWGPTSLSRAALETLYAQGRIGIDYRVNTRRHFNLIEKLVPTKILQKKDPNRSKTEYQEWHVHRRIGSMGIASAKSGDHWLGIQGARKVAERNKILQRLVTKGSIKVLNIEGMENKNYYIQSEHLDLLNTVREGDTNSEPSAAFIAPLDNLIWNRTFLEEIFGFKYIWEVYKPKKDRVYGYYVLPVFYVDTFIARVDMKFDRQTNVLHLNNWWWENATQHTSIMEREIKYCFEEFIDYLGAKDFQINTNSLSGKLDKSLLP